MRVAVGNDHRGVDAKRRVLATVLAMNDVPTDLGTNATIGVDYPDFAIAVSEAVASGQADRGVLICATGHGMCITANKVYGIRAVNCRDIVDAEMSRTHNDANVLCLSADLLSEDMIEQIVRKWIETPFENGSGRHARRNEKITQYEAAHQKK
ncbi:RpiB/LacA/LacB family sugar-phosphate isomerase [Limnoglobus roseus]|uniref:Ribose 5-phosphate isomerase B n=1 Tax=Limnoglobus roseus TaxID=2598579 RepID=A0A5C1AG42_9BACT|nr:RpiB/LacA/LacB family sugar-phosphate isomerase [Limnoglobus roseus]QEL16094.1 ribose 5-phosphate isomerase B [Limnoglobus roseus]